VVTDTGAGIAPDVLPHIFERFRQAHAGSTRTHGGLGIGLSLVRNLVELHGGTVSGTSEGEGKGAAFVVRLPALEDSARAAPRAPHQRPVHAPMQLPSLDGLRILAVDDEPDSLDVVAEVLTRAGADVRRARSASAALSLVDGWQPDVLLSDIEMPGEDGYAFIARFRQRVGGDGIPAIAVTAYGRVEDRQRALAAGFVEHVTKPVDPAQLVTAVASLVRHRAA
jgi:CheY-like chemotaxis protein